MIKVTKKGIAPPKWEIRLDLDVEQTIMAFLASHAHLKSTPQGKKALIEIMGLGVRITWIL